MVALLYVDGITKSLRGLGGRHASSVPASEGIAIVSRVLGLRPMGADRFQLVIFAEILNGDDLPGGEGEEHGPGDGGLPPSRRRRVRARAARSAGACGSRPRAR